jgi:copper(I)-binding protein
MSIDLGHPWARMQTARPGEAAGFVTLTNRGPEPDRLIAATTPLAEKTGIWGIKVMGANMRMQPMEHGLLLPVEMAIELKPRGYHLFFQGLAKPLVRGQKVPVTLTFAQAAPRQIELVVEGEGAISDDTLMEPQAG